jgi:phosphoribosylaminoimidazole-succinocarboxamide synthase
MQKRDELYRGKAKTVFLTDDADKLVLYFRNDTSAFDGEKIEQLETVRGQVSFIRVEHLDQ